jgi:hypothetical protein
MSKAIALLAGSVGLALLTTALAAEPPERSRETIRLRVPVKLKTMLAKQVRVRCWIRRATDNGYPLSNGNGTTSEWLDIPDGEFDRVVEIVMTPRPDLSFAEASTYDCRLELPGGSPFGYSAPRLGTPSSNPNDPDNSRVAKSDEFFRTQVVGRLAPRRWPSGNTAPGRTGGNSDLTIGEKPRQ